MRRQLFVMAAGAIVVSLLTAAPALSDPPAGTTPRPADIVGAGSGTTQYLLDALAARYDVAHRAGPHIYSYDAPARAGSRVTLKSGCKPVPRPGDGAAGLALLHRGVRDRAHYCLDFARSSSGPAPGNPAGLTYLPLAADNVTYAVISHGSHAPATLSTTYLHDIYTCTATRWTQVGGTSSATIRPLLPQPGSETAAFFLAAIHVKVPGRCVRHPASLAENEGTSPVFTGKNAPDELIPFSAARWLAQAYHSPACETRGCPAGRAGAPVRCKKPARGQNKFGCDLNGHLKLGDINGTVPFTGRGAGAVLSPRFAAAFVRTLYDVVRGSGRIPSYLKHFFGQGGAFCSTRYQSLITDYGFEPTLACGTPPWIIRTVAGTGPHGYNGDGIPATRAELHGPGDVTIDGAGNLVFSDGGNGRVRVVAARAGTFYGIAMKQGDIYTIAGDGTYGYNGDGIPATRAELGPAVWVALDGAGNLVMTDPSNERVRVVAATTGTFYGIAMKQGDIYTVAGDGKFGYNGDGIPATSAKLDAPSGITVDGAGNLVFSDDGNYRVRVVAATTGTFYGIAMKQGDIYTIAGDGNPVYNGDGIPATSAAVDPSRVTFDHAGNLVIADSSRVRVVAARTGTFYGMAMKQGDIYTIAGDGTDRYTGDRVPATSVGLLGPDAIAVDGAGNVVITGGSRVLVVAARTGTFYGMAMKQGDIYTIAGDGYAGWNGDGIAGPAAELSLPDGVVVDSAGDLVISDSENNRVRVLSAP